MSSENERPINVALFGMDERTTNAIKSYLAGPCEGLAIVAVDENNADVDIIDADYTKAKDVLDERKENSPERPIILLSLEELFLEGTIFVQKPIQEDDLILVLEEIRQTLFKQPTTDETASPDESNQDELSTELEVSLTDDQEDDVATVDKVEEFISLFSKNKITEEIEIKNKRIIEKHRASKLEELQRKFYNPKNYFLGYLKSSFKVVKKKGVILELHSGWKPLFLFPDSNEVWIDADEKELKRFSRKTIDNNPDQKMALKSVSKRNSLFKRKAENFYDMDAFIWKMAVWTSKGRYPVSININKPLYLKYWPNFTQLMVTPHALRIAALLVTVPRSAINIADSLKIDHQYVFMFISATNAVGLLGQAKRQEDEMVAPPKLEISKSKEYIGRILTKLGA